MAISDGLLKVEAVVRFNKYSLCPRGNEDHPGPSFNSTISDLLENLGKVIEREERLADEERKQKYNSYHHNNI